MQRDNRDTAKWFHHDQRATLDDQAMASARGPGKYDGQAALKQANKNQQISWNVGKVPFGTCNQRFKPNHRPYFQPGPDKYDPKSITAPFIQDSTSLTGTNNLSVDVVAGANYYCLSPPRIVFVRDLRSNVCLFI